MDTSSRDVTALAVNTLWSAGVVEILGEPTRWAPVVAVLSLTFGPRLRQSGHDHRYGMTRRARLRRRVRAAEDGYDPLGGHDRDGEP